MSKTVPIPRIEVPPAGSGDDSGKHSASERRTILLAPPVDAQQSAPVSLTSSYGILEKIGDGGMGVVYLARDRKLGRYVAIKRLNKAGLSDPSLRKRFFREAEAIAALQHSNIVHVYALAEDDEGPYIVMEYVAGPSSGSPDKQPPRPFTLADKVHRDGPPPVSEALSLIIKVGRAIEYAHGCGVIHRDLKPSNILIDHVGEPKIVDFGLAHRARGDDVPLTVPGEKMLSIGYGAPEQEKDATTTDERTDVYGLGALLYFSLTGHNPRYFREKDLPEALRMPIVRALETDKEKRWARASDFTDALVLIHAPSTIELPTVKTTWRCKWCDTVNPTAIQFCGKCGWNGGEICSECGTETRVGIPFCGSCGADAREYERANLLLASMIEHADKKEFEFIVRHSGQISGFLPAGYQGQRLVADIQRRHEEARYAIERREELLKAIDREFKREDYERVQRHVAELKTISDDNIFNDMQRDLPGLIAARDLGRAREAVDKGDLEYAQRACTGILTSISPSNREARNLLRTIARRKIARRGTRTGIVAIVMFFLYVFSAAPAYRLMKEKNSSAYYSVYEFVELLHDATILKRPLEQYASMCGVPEMFSPVRENN
ncbi:MAG: serine/threonine-protein kinase [Kiritimatiellia bacterium]|nr:serine/threonine-protein kinase [Kiritimatiellia bacterium]